MKPYFKAKIKTLDQAYAFFEQLYRDGLLFHPEDSPWSVWDSTECTFLFTIPEAFELAERIKEVYQFDFDPCAFCLGLSGHLEGEDDRHKS